MKDIDSAHHNPNNNQPPREQASVSRPATQQTSVSLLKPRQKIGGKKILKRLLWTIVGVVIILGGLVFARAANLSSKIFVGQKTTFLGQVFDLIRGGGDNQKLVGEDLGQINVLLLGVGGEGHDGPYLTDTMILAQIRPDIGEVTITSIPRDYYTTLPDGSNQKINAAFATGLGSNMDWNEAGSYARQVVQNVSGLQIPYFAVMDFSGFEQAINLVGGVDVTVDRTFTDYQYPDSGTGYLPPQTFTAGPQHMDGARALIFARSRHAAGYEGSDFARSLRQQKIIEAFKQKVLSMNLITGASTINQLVGIFADHFHTNMSPAEIYQLFNLVKDKNMTILPLSLDPDTHLICQEILASDGAYILTPCAGESTQDVQNFFKNSFSAAKIKSENATVWLASSTGDQAAYDTAFRELTDAGLTVYQLGYSKDDLPQTTIYQVNPKPATAEFITNTLNAAAVTLPPPGVTPDKNKVDVIIVLGQNAVSQPAPPAYVPPPAQQAATTTEDSSSTPTSTSTTNSQ